MILTPKEADHEGTSRPRSVRETETAQMMFGVTSFTLWLKWRDFKNTNRSNPQKSVTLYARRQRYLKNLELQRIRAKQHRRHRRALCGNARACEAPASPPLTLGVRSVRACMRAYRGAEAAMVQKVDTLDEFEEITGGSKCVHRPPVPCAHRTSAARARARARLPSAAAPPGSPPPLLRTGTSSSTSLRRGVGRAR